MTATITLSKKQLKMIDQVKSRSFKLYLLKNLPIGLFVGMKVIELSPESCTTSVPFKWLTKNPFKSVYFAVQCMAAELSTAATCLLAVTGKNPSVALIIVDLKAKFLKKATSKVYFTCANANDAFTAVTQCIESGEPAETTLKTVGKMSDGTIVSEFEFVWSFKQRTKS
jgi:hypothetical protein